MSKQMNYTEAVSRITTLKEEIEKRKEENSHTRIAKHILLTPLTLSIATAAYLNGASVIRSIAGGMAFSLLFDTAVELFFDPECKRYIKELKDEKKQLEEILPKCR